MFSQLIAHYTQHHWEPGVKFATFVWSEFFFHLLKKFNFLFLFLSSPVGGAALATTEGVAGTNSEQQISLIYWLVRVNLLIPDSCIWFTCGRTGPVFRSLELDDNIHTSPNKTDSPSQATRVQSKWADSRHPVYILFWHRFAAHD